MIPPHGATAEGTRLFHKERKNPVCEDKLRSFRGLAVSALGLGTYLGNFDDETDRDYESAIHRALDLGCNVFDAAINYRCQRSERTIGRALKKYFDSKELHRSHVVITTKGGFIPFDSAPPSNMANYIREKFIHTGLISAEDIVSSCHCLHPRFLQKQIDDSLSNLGLETIDLYYLHNPEIQLPEVGPEEFYKRIQKAFELLEENVSRGKIQFYGLATWTGFREPVGAPESVALSRVADIAKAVSGNNHHFRGIQLPYNLAMLEAIEVHNQDYQGRSLPVISAASLHGVSAFISAPLLQSQLLNLPSTITDKMPGALTTAQKALQFVTSTPSVCSALAGMKTIEHVQENLDVLHQSNWDLDTLLKICDHLVKS